MKGGRGRGRGIQAMFIRLTPENRKIKQLHKHTAHPIFHVKNQLGSQRDSKRKKEKKELASATGTIPR